MTAPTGYGPYGTPPQGPPPRKRHTIRKILTIAAGVVVGLIVLIVALALIVPSGAKTGAPAASAPASTAPAAPANAPSASPSPSGPAMLSPGQPEVITDSSNATIGTVTVDSITVSTHPADPSYGSAPANGYYVVAHITASADPSYTQGYDINSLDFYALAHGQQFQEDNGNAFDALSGSQSNSDITATLGAGQTSSGWISFDVSHPHGTIDYSPNSDGQPIAAWTY